MKRYWPVWVLLASVVGLGLAMWWRWGTPVWMEQAIAWCT